MNELVKNSVSKVVVVEEDPTFLQFWIRMLKDLGAEDCEFFSDAADAEASLKKTPCHILISGVVMPQALGYELAKIAYDKNPHCNIILSTAYSTDLSRFDIAKFPFHLIHKPYKDIGIVKSLLKHVIDGSISLDDMSEDSFSENEYYPHVTEWEL